MIGSHDSYTYSKPRKKIMNLFSFMWRTQTKSILKQIGCGVTYFDIRVRRDKDKWRVCHGIVDFDHTFPELQHILELFSKYKVRILLERGNNTDVNIFKEEVNTIKDNPILSFAGIKKNWHVLVNKDPKLIDYTYIPWRSNLSFIQNIKVFNFFSTIKRWARKHNPSITEALIEDSTLHFIDRI